MDKQYSVEEIELLISYYELPEKQPSAVPAIIKQLLARVKELEATVEKLMSEDIVYERFAAVKFADKLNSISKICDSSEPEWPGREAAIKALQERGYLPALQSLIKE